MITTSTRTKLSTRLVAAAGGVLALTLAATMVTGTAQAAGGPTAVTQGQGQSEASAAALPDSPEAVCATNAGRANGDGITAQNFEAAYDEYDSWGAADFRVTANCRVRTVFIPGVSSGTASGITISFHVGSPANPAHCLTSKRGTGPNFTVNVTRCTLKPGKIYWLVVQVSQRFDDQGQWFWATTNTRHAGLDQWKNPGDGHLSGCTSWDTVDNCLGFAYDYRFSVKS